MMHRLKAKRVELLGLAVAALAILVAAAGTATAATGARQAAPLTPSFSEAVAFDVSLPLSSLAWKAPLRRLPPVSSQEPIEIRPERGPVIPDQGYSGDGALQKDGARVATPAIPGTLANFEGLSNQDNFNIFGGRVNPPDPNGDVGPNHYVEMINLVFGVYDKTGNLLLGTGRDRHVVGGLCDPRLHGPVRRSHRAVRPARGPLAPEPVHDPRSRWECAELQLRRGFGDRRPDRCLLPVCIQHDVQRPLLFPRLPQVRRLDELVSADLA